MSSHEHRREAAREHGARRSGAAVLTVSDTRTLADDASGDLVCDRLAEVGAEIVHRDLVPDEPGTIENRLVHWLHDATVQIIVSTGGTGIHQRDTTADVVRRYLTVELEGFGELFRSLSYAEIGAAAMLSRAVGGLVVQSPADGGDTFVFALPGSRHAVDTAMTKLIVPEVPHLLWERRR
jgi:molybdenum cofactor biosynthesis protein B